MKKLSVFFVLFLFLAGCSASNQTLLKYEPAPEAPTGLVIVPPAETNQPEDISRDFIMIPTEQLLDIGDLKPGQCWILARHQICKIPAGMSFSQLCADLYGSGDPETVKMVWKQAFAMRVLHDPNKILAGEVFVLPNNIFME